MANEDINIKIRTTGASKVVSDINRVSKSMKAVGGSSGLANNAILNVTRGINDARYGFQGMANNAEFVVESFGQLIKQSGGLKTALATVGRSILGPIGIVAGVSLLIGYGPEIYAFFKDKLGGGAKEAALELEKLNKVQNETIDGWFIRMQQAAREDIKNYEARIRQIDEFEAANGQLWKNQGKRLSEERAEKKRLLQEAIDFDNKLIDGMQARAAAAVKAYEEESRAKNAANSGKRDKTSIASTITPDGTTLEQLKAWQKTATGLVKSFAHEWNIAWGDVGKITVTKGEELTNAIKATAKKLGHEVNTMTSEISSAASSLQSSAAAAFSGLGVAIGEALVGDGNFGEKFLGVLGSFMTQFGSALIALGIAESAWLSSFDPVSKIAAGAALVVAGAAISSAYSKKPGSSKNASSRNPGAGTFTPIANPTFSTSQQGGNRVIGELELRGQNLVVGLQAANETRNTF